MILERAARQRLAASSARYKESALASVHAPSVSTSDALSTPAEGVTPGLK